MRVVALTKFKHGDLFHALQKLGWSQSDLAKNSGVAVGRVCDITNLKYPPNKEEAEKIQKTFALYDVYFDILEAWPQGFKGFVGRKKSLTLISEFECNASDIAEETIAHIPPPDQDFILNTEGTDSEAKVNEIIEKSKLSQLEKSAITVRFGIKDGKKSTYRKTAFDLKVKYKSLDNALIRAFTKMKKTVKEMS